MAPQLTSETLSPVLPRSLYFLIFGAADSCPVDGLLAVLAERRPATPSPTAPEAIEVMNCRLFKPDMSYSPSIQFAAFFTETARSGASLAARDPPSPPMIWMAKVSPPLGTGARKRPTAASSSRGGSSPDRA